MSNMREQMQTLVRDLASSARERHAAVENNRVVTARILAAASGPRMHADRILKAGWAADHKLRSAQVRAIQTDTRALRREFRHAHTRMEHRLRRELAQSSESVATLVTAMRANWSKERAEVAKAQRNVGIKLRAELVKDRRDRSHEVTRLVHSMHVSHSSMAHRQRDSIAKFMHELTSQRRGSEPGFSILPRNRSTAAAASAQGPRMAFPVFSPELDERKRKEGRAKPKEDGRHSGSHSRAKAGETPPTDDIE